MSTIIRNIKPAVCPTCGSHKVLKSNKGRSAECQNARCVDFGRAKNVGQFSMAANVDLSHAGPRRDGGPARF